MKISELAGRAGVPVSAVKYYLREGLLPEAEKSAPNQAAYGEEHLRRIRLIRALMGTGRLSVARTKEVVTALDTVPLAEVFEVAQQALGADDAAPGPDPASRERVVALARHAGWCTTENNPGIDAAARALDGFAAIGYAVSDDYLRAYAGAAAVAAHADLRALAEVTAPERVTELMVVGTVLGDPLFAGLRRLAQQSATAEVFPTGRTLPTEQE